MEGFARRFAEMYRQSNHLHWACQRMIYIDEIFIGKNLGVREQITSSVYERIRKARIINEPLCPFLTRTLCQCPLQNLNELFIVLLSSQMIFKLGIINKRFQS